MSRDFKVCSLEIERFQSQNPSRVDKSTTCTENAVTSESFDSKVKSLETVPWQFWRLKQPTFLAHGWKTWFQMPTIEKGGL